MKDLPKVVECAHGRNFPEGSELGSGRMCHYIKDNKLHVCSAYMAITGRHPQKDQQFDEEWQCALDYWVPILLLEASRTNRGQTEAIENLHTTVAEGNKKAQEVLQESIHGIVRETVIEMLESSGNAILPRQ